MPRICGDRTLDDRVEGVIPQKYRTDGLHIAHAAVNGLDMIISMNFQHIVKRKTIKMPQNIQSIKKSRITRPFIDAVGSQSGHPASICLLHNPESMMILGSVPILFGFALLFDKTFHSALHLTGGVLYQVVD